MRHRHVWIVIIIIIVAFFLCILGIAIGLLCHYDRVNNRVNNRVNDDRGGGPEMFLYEKDVSDPTEEIEGGATEKKRFAIARTRGRMVAIEVFEIPTPSEERSIGSPRFRIPLVVHVCWRNPWIPRRVYDQIFVKNRSMLDGFETRFYTNETIEPFLSLYFPPIVLEAYRLLNPHYGACLGDFFRYCVLYIFGGMYMDLKSCLTRPLIRLWETHFRTTSEETDADLFFVSYWPNARYHRIQTRELGNTEGEIMNWILCASPRHPFVKKVIDGMVAQIFEWHKHQYRYGEKINVLRLTGPIFLTTTILRGLPDPTIVIEDDLNQYAQYSCQSTGMQIHDDRLVYGLMKIPHYTTRIDPIVLFRYQSSSHFIFVFDETDAEVIRASANASRKGFEPAFVPYTLPTDCRDPKIISFLDDCMRTLEVDSTMRAMLLTDTDALVRLVSSWPVACQKDLIRCTALYIHGGYFIDSPPNEWFSFFHRPYQPWDAYAQNVDVCVFWDPSAPRHSCVIPTLLKFPAQSPTLKTCLENMIRMSFSPIMNHLSILLTQVVVTQCRTSGIDPSQGAVLPVAYTKYTETWLVGTLDREPRHGWTSFWTETPPQTISVYHCAGQILATGSALFVSSATGSPVIDPDPGDNNI